MNDLLPNNTHYWQVYHKLLLFYFCIHYVVCFYDYAYFLNFQSLKGMTYNHLCMYIDFIILIYRVDT